MRYTPHAWQELLTHTQEKGLERRGERRGGTLRVESCENPPEPAKAPRANRVGAMCNIYTFFVPSLPLQKVQKLLRENTRWEWGLMLCSSFYLAPNNSDEDTVIK